MNASEKTAEQIASAAKANAATYLTEIPPEIDPARRLLEQYSGIAPEDIDAHIYKIVRKHEPLCIRRSDTYIELNASSEIKPGPSSHTDASDPSRS
jgi:hypothetical protein